MTELAAAHERQQVPGNRKCARTLLTPKPLRSRFAIPVQMAAGLAAGAGIIGTVGDTTPRNLFRCRVNEPHNAARLSTSAPLAIGGGTIRGKEIAIASAERVGMSTQLLERVAGMNQRYVDQGRIAGVLTAVVRDGKLVHQSAAGTRSVADPTPLSRDSLFRLYSMTKPITAVAAMQLYERGRFQLTDPVTRFVPELKEMTVLKDGEAVPVKQRMTMQHLLSHTSGLSYGGDPRDPVDQMYLEADLWKSRDLDEFAAKVGTIPLQHEPGDRWHYSVASDIVGLVVQRVGGQPLDEYFNQYIFRPLDMADTSFVVSKENADRLVPNHIRDKDSGKPCLIDSSGSLPVSPPSALEVAAAAHDYHDVTLFLGGGGLVSTLRDYVRFAEAMRAGGSLEGERVLSPKSVDYMTANHLPGALKGGYTGAPLTGAAQPIRGAGFGLGCAVVIDPTAHGVVGSPGQYYWNGLAGTAFFVDPREDIAVVSMMQLLNSWHSYPQDLRVATYQAVTDSRIRN
ncbi:MAG: serine hydrolase [Gammaproteobacteria bacterium]|nr:serine hydrolase [Gammaproteobacteria bacterium]MDE0368048.1 serine hydrolase [Gammaproteobacteria bacterium]